MFYTLNPTLALPFAGEGIGSLSRPRVASYASPCEGGGWEGVLMNLMKLINLT